MTPHLTTIQRQTLETLTRLTAIHPQLTQTWQALRDAQPGYPTNTNPTHTTPHLKPDGTPPGLDRYLNTPDPATHDLKQLTHLTHQIHQLTTQLHELTRRWTTTPTPNTPQRTPTGGDCIACGRYTPGTPNDRLRAGLDLSCYQSWRRSKLDRQQWLHQRKQQLATNPTTP